MTNLDATQDFSWGRLRWPVLVGSVAGAAVFLAQSGGLPLAATALPVAVIVSLALLERIAAADSSATWWADPQLRCDIGHALVGGWLAERLGTVLLVAAAATIAAFLPTALSVWPTGLPVAAQALLLIVFAEGLEYARHRGLHAWDRGWALHRLHHDSDRLHVLKASRIHFLDLLTRFAFVFAPLVLLGAPAELLPAYSLALLCLGPVSHANLSLPLPRWVHRVLVTPDVHRIHHARSLSLSQKNLAPILPIFDIVFGTWQAPEETHVVAFGSDEPDAPRTFAGQLAGPVRELFADRSAQ